jgi:hypothetical protein
MEEVVQLSMNYRILLLVFLFCLTAGSVPVASTGDYLGGGIQLGGSGSGITQVTTAATSAVVVPPTVTAIPGSLSITTTPAGATVFIDHVQRGVSPATIPDLAPGTHALRLEMNGYTQVTVLVTITAGQTQTYTTALSPAVGAAATTSSQPASKKTPGFEPVLALVAMGVIMTLNKLS